MDFIECDQVEMASRDNNQRLFSKQPSCCDNKPSKTQSYEYNSIGYLENELFLEKNNDNNDNKMLLIGSFLLFCIPATLYMYLTITRGHAMS